MKFIITTFLLLTFNVYSIQAQTLAIDSLEKQLETPPNDSVKAYLLGQIAWKLRGIDLKKALEYGTYSIQIIENQNYYQIKAQVYNFLGVIYRNLHDYSNALKCYYKALKAGQKHQQDIQIAYAHNNIGEIFRYQGRLKDAEINTRSAAKIFVKTNNKTGEAYAYLRLGEILQRQKK